MSVGTSERISPLMSLFANGAVAFDGNEPEGAGAENEPDGGRPENEPDGASKAETGASEGAGPDGNDPENDPDGAGPG